MHVFIVCWRLEKGVDMHVCFVILYVCVARGRGGGSRRCRVPDGCIHHGMRALHVQRRERATTLHLPHRQTRSTLVKRTFQVDQHLQQLVCQQPAQLPRLIRNLLHALLGAAQRLAGAAEDAAEQVVNLGVSVL